MTTARWRSPLILMAILFAVTIALMLDDVIFYLLFESLLEWKLNWLAKLGIGIVIFILNLALALLVIKALQAKPQTGAEGLIDEQGIVERVALPDYWVKVHGELWRAQSHERLAVGEKVLVRKMKGLKLEVEPLNEK